MVIVRKRADVVARAASADKLRPARPENLRGTVLQLFREARRQRARRQ